MSRFIRDGAFTVFGFLIGALLATVPAYLQEQHRLNNPEPGIDFPVAWIDGLADKEFVSRVRFNQEAVGTVRQSIARVSFDKWLRNHGVELSPDQLDSITGKLP